MRIIILFSLLFLFQSVFSQITVDRNDFGQIGDTVLLERTLFGLDTLSPGSSGASQFWDFSMLQTDTIPDTLFFLDPAGFPQSSGLSANVNLVLKDGSSLQFIEANSNGIFGYALTLDLDTFASNLLVESNPQLEVYNFPMTYASSNSGTYTSNTITLPVKDTLTISSFTFYVDSIRINPTINKVDSVNAFGTLLLPGQQQFDVLRQKSTINLSFSISVLIPNPLPFPPPFIWFPIPAGTFPDIESTSYTFLAKGENYPVLELNTDSLDQIISARFQMDTSGFDSTVHLTSEFQNLSVYPNPAENRIFIEGLARNSFYELRNELGINIRSGKFKNEEDFINLEKIKSGFYILIIKSEDSNGIAQFRVFKK
ncbi:MAG: T9SS type A sorting domain-containing protein [Cytophagales bacterium]